MKKAINIRLNNQGNAYGDHSNTEDLNAHQTSNEHGSTMEPEHITDFINYSDKFTASSGRQEHGNSRNNDPAPSFNVDGNWQGRIVSMSTPENGPEATMNVSQMPKRRPGRPSMFTKTDDITLIREVAAKRAHTAPFGTKQERWEAVSNACNQSKAMSRKMSPKSARDRFLLLLTTFKTNDKTEAITSGVGGSEPTEEEQLLHLMMTQIEQQSQKVNNARQTEIAREKSKEVIGQRILSFALGRKTTAQREAIDGSIETELNVQEKGKLSEHSSPIMSVGLNQKSSASRANEQAENSPILNLDCVQNPRTDDVQRTIISPTSHFRNSNSITQVTSNENIDNRQNSANSSSTINIRDPLSERRKRRRISLTQQNSLSDDIEGFGMSIRDGDIARAKVEEKKIELERERLHLEKQDRQDDRNFKQKEAERKDRVEKERLESEYKFRKEELEAREKSDLERTKFLFDLLKDNLKKN